MTPAEIDQYMNMFLILVAIIGAGYMAWRLMKPKPVITEKKVPQRPINKTFRIHEAPDDVITDYDEIPKNREMARPTLRMPQSSKSFRYPSKERSYNSGSSQNRSNVRRDDNSYVAPSVIASSGDSSSRCDSPSYSSSPDSGSSSSSDGGSCGGGE